MDKYSVFELQNMDWLTNLHKLASKEKGNSIVVVCKEQLTPRHVLPILAKEPYFDQLM